ncbi:ABC transporter ATP-binding protein [Taibaiella soli]|uniref:ABC transporter ATP-binding protein n=1 Tax=Taibaiella soli TaxID=1649169 RepID=A0A2W2BFG4_9BACT|nr:ATP-binding cassette domain-containing protein [Taibaiella soli]PZF74607.1 ABC transporter ATP-binding protein [Taibaiella soli]
MKISLEHTSKRFLRHWIFKDINYTFSAPGAYALLGANGSGKSTLLRIIAGMQNPSLGKVFHFDNDKLIENSNLFPYISFCAPGMEIVEEFTLHEFLEFHFSFKKMLPGLSISSIIELCGLQAAADRVIGEFSSGMKQRVKLAQAIFADTPMLLLDEPCTNLDQAGVEQYTNWMEQYAKNRLVIVASNDVREYFFCKEQLTVEDYR